MKILDCVKTASATTVGSGRGGNRQLDGQFCT